MGGHFEFSAGHLEAPGGTLWRAYWDSRWDSAASRVPSQQVP
jgi:hypothetical protein